MKTKFHFMLKAKLLRVTLTGVLVMCSHAVKYACGGILALAFA
jgi:hypothetical protein